VRGRFSKLPRGAHRVRARERGGGGETTGAPSAGRFSLHSTVAERRVRIAPPHRIRRLARRPRSRTTDTSADSTPLAPDGTTIEVATEAFVSRFLASGRTLKICILIYAPPKNLFTLDSDHFVSVYFVFIYTNVCALVAVSVFILACVPFRVICIAAGPAVPFAPSVSLSIRCVCILFMPIDARAPA
jgi:hypothetical protein